MQFQKNTSYYQDRLNFAVVIIFWQKQCLYSKQQYESCVKDFLVLFSVFVRLKVAFNENLRTADYALGIRLLDCLESPINRKNVDDDINCRHDISSIFLPGLIAGPTPQFRNNIITGSGVMTIFVDKGLTRNPEVGNTTV